MVVHFTPNGVDVFDEHTCPACDETDTLTDTGCGAPGCRGYACTECGWGCDMDAMGDAGRCGQALAAETDDDRADRIDTERAAYGLAPIGGDR